MGYTFAPSDIAVINITRSTTSAVLPGMALPFAVTIAVQPKSSVDVQLQVLGTAPSATTTHFALSAVNVDLGTLQQTANSDPQPRESSTLPEVHDGLYYDLGRLTNPGRELAAVTVEFVAALVDYSGAATGDDVFLYIAGDYDNHVYAFSEIFNYTVDYTKVPPAYSVNVLCNPLDLEVESFTLCTATLSTPDQFASPVSATVRVSNLDSLDALSCSTANIRELEGERTVHFPAPATFTRTAAYSSLGVENFRDSASLDLGQVVKPGGDGNLVLEFAVAAGVSASAAGQSIVLNVTVEAEGAMAGLASHTLAVVHKAAPEAGLQVGMLTIDMADQDANGTTEVQSGYFFHYDVKVNLTGHGGKHRMFLFTEPTDPGVSVCSIETTGWSFNTPQTYIPEANGDNVFGYSIFNTEQISDPDAALVTYRVTSAFVGDTSVTATVNFLLEDDTNVPASGTAELKVSNDSVVLTPDFLDHGFERPWTTLEGNRVSVFTVKLKLAADALYPDLRLLVTPDVASPNVPVRVCHSYLSHVGRSLPCLKGQKDVISKDLNITMSTSTSYFDNSLALPLGSVASLPPSPDDDYWLHLSVLVTLPWGRPGVDVPPADASGQSYTYSVGAAAGDTLIWTGSVGFDLAAATGRSASNLSGGSLVEPQVYLLLDDVSAPLAEERFYGLVAKIKIGPGMSHDLELLVEVPEGVGLCRLTLRLRGRNLACVQGGDWYRGERFSWLNTSRLHYEPDEVNVTRARLTFFGITNAGSQPITENQNDHNDLLVNVPLLPPPGFSGGIVRATLREWEGSQAAWASANLSLPAAAAPVDGSAPNGTSLAFSMVPTAASPGWASVMEVEVGVPRGVNHLMSVVITGAPEDASVCSAHVTFVGDFMPCLNGTSVSSQPLSNGLLIELGRVCRVEQQLVDDHVDADIIRAKVAFLPINPAVSTLQFTADVLYDGIAQELLVVSPAIPVDANSSLVGSNANPLVTGGVFNDSVLSVKETSTAVFNVSVPIGQTIQVLAVLSTSPAKGRSSFLLSNVRLLYAGRNVECSVSTAEIAMTSGGMALNGSYFADEVDIISLDFGFITNTGLTALTFNDKDEDNVFSLAVDAFLTDAYWNDHMAVAEVYLKVSNAMNKQWSSGKAGITVVRNQTLLPQVGSSLTVQDNTTIYRPLDVVTLSFELWQQEASMCEPINVRLRVHLPFADYLRHRNTSVVGVEPRAVTLSHAGALLTAEYDILRFGERSEMNFTFEVNPGNNVHFGYGLYTMSVPYSLSLGLPQRFRVDGFTRFPDNDKGRIPPTTGYVTVKMQSLECFNDLNMNDASLMPACLFTASSAMDADHSPDHVRLSSTTPWAPRVSAEIQWVQVDMVNQHRVTQLRHQAHPDYHQAETVAVMVSDDGLLWRRSDEIAVPEQTEVFEYLFQPALEARYFRFVVKSWRGGSGLSGFRFDLRGCPLGADRTPEDVCSTPVLPPTGAAGSSGRHFAVDTVSGAAYICERPAGSQVNQCFYSSDNAMSWSRTPPYVTEVLGFWPDANKIYGASSSPAVGYFFTNDTGLTWTPTTQIDVEAANTSSSWVPSIAVPYDAPGTSVRQTLSAWSADTQGVFKDGQMVVSWSACCSPFAV